MGADGLADRQLLGWYRRGETHPPHFDGGVVPQFLTFRLAGTLPRAILDRWKEELALGRITDPGLRERIEAHLDAGAGECWLKDRRITAIVRDAFLHFDGDRYALHGWVVMPNHAHVLITPADGRRLPDILHSWKSFTAKRANQVLGRTGPFWEDDYFDRYSRGPEDFERTLAYIAANPVVAGLCRRPEDWEWSHARAWGSGVPPDSS